MNIGSILSKIGGSVIKSVVPGLGIATEIVGVINSFLPSDKKLSDNATGTDAQKAIALLPLDKQAELMEKKYDVEITEIQEWSNVIESLGEVDKTGHTTRPAIAMRMSQLIAFGVVITLSPIAYAIVVGDPKMILSISQIWPVIATVIGIPAGIVNSYFGKRSKEKAQKYEAVSSVPQVGGAISQIANIFKK